MCIELHIGCVVLVNRGLNLVHFRAADGAGATEEMDGAAAPDARPPKRACRREPPPPPPPNRRRLVLQVHSAYLGAVLYGRKAVEYRRADGKVGAAVRRLSGDDDAAFEPFELELRAGMTAAPWAKFDIQDRPRLVDVGDMRPHQGPRQGTDEFQKFFGDAAQVYAIELGKPIAFDDPESKAQNAYRSRRDVHGLEARMTHTRHIPTQAANLEAEARDARSRDARAADRARRHAFEAAHPSREGVPFEFEEALRCIEAEPPRQLCPAAEWLAHFEAWRA